MRALAILGVATVLACACAGGGALRAQDATVRPAPSRAAQPWEGPGEETTPLRVDVAGAADVRSVRVVRVERRLPAAVAAEKLAVVAGGVAYFTGQSALDAVDLADGTVLWHRDAVSPYDMNATPTRAFVPVVDRSGVRTQVLAARSGRLLTTLQNVGNLRMLRGYFYALRSTGWAYVAYDATTLRPLWVHSAGGGFGGPPVQHDAVLFQAFTESGAITVNAMHAFDIRSGRELWRTGWGPVPLGFSKDVVYLDSTWFPVQYERYYPVSIKTVEVATGQELHDYGYKPDPSRHARAELGSSDRARSVLVSGGYVYMHVGDDWYRYDADRPPADAHPVRLDGITEVAALDGDKLIVADAGSVSIAQALSDRLILHRVGGALGSSVVTADDGSRVLVAGGHVFVIHDGPRVEDIGAVPCAAVDAGNLVVWERSVTVRCAGWGDDRVVTFRDVLPAVVAAAPHPMAAPPPRFSLALHAYRVPPGPPPLRGQWYPSALVAAPDGGVVAVLSSGALNVPNALARVGRKGEIALVQPSGVAPPAKPSDAVVDDAGTVWFNDDRWAGVTALEPSGALHPIAVGEVTSPSPAPSGFSFGLRRGRGIRVALGPDGKVWFARTHPTPQVGQVNGARRFAIPATVGEILTLARGSDGALWFLTPTSIGRMTMDGKFSTIPFAPDIRAALWPSQRLVAGAAGTMWFTAGRHIMRLNAHGILHDFVLPDASSAVTAITVGCDGTVYAADRLGTQLVRIGADGVIEEQRTELFSIDDLATASDCRTWFIGGSNAPDQQVGTFAFLPRKG